MSISIRASAFVPFPFNLFKFSFNLPPAYIFSMADINYLNYRPTAHFHGNPTVVITVGSEAFDATLF